MKYTLKKKNQELLISSSNSIVTEVNEEFINFTGYSRDDLVGKSLKEISYMLRIDAQMELEKIQNEYSCFMFTKSFEPREVTIFCKSSDCQGKKSYIFKENPKSRLKDKFIVTEQFYEHNKIGVAISTLPDGILLRANQKYLDFLDEPYNKKENSIGRRYTDIINGFKESNLDKAVSYIMERGELFHADELKYDYFNRGVTYWDAFLVPIFIEGKAKYLVQNIFEVTEKVLSRKFAEEQSEALKRQKEQLDAIIENMSDALLIFDKDGNYTRFNKAARKTYLDKTNKMASGYTTDDIHDLFDMDNKLITKGNLPLYKLIKGENLSGNRIAVKSHDGVVYHEINGTPLYDSEGNFVSGILCSRDVTENIKYEADLLEKTQYGFLNRLIDNLYLPVIRLSYPDFKITDINQKGYAFVKGLNMEFSSIQDLKGQKYSDIIIEFEKDKILKHIHGIVNNNGNSYSKYIKFIVSGEEKFMKILYQPVIGLNGEVIEVVVIIIDVTNEIKAKNHMEENLRMQEEFLANISHELKTPLNVIFSTSQLFELYLNNDLLIDNKDKINNNIHILRQNCYRLTKLISNIVDLSKIDSGFFELNLSNENIVNITEDIVQSVSQYVQSKGMHITFDTNVEEKIIACDPDKLERIILNLISNAVKFSRSGDEIFVLVDDKGDTVEISVKDQGIGIDKNYLNYIFERFKQVDKSFSRNAEGSGIGLCLVKSIVELHGGKISATSKLGEGSEFKIELPAGIIESSKKSDKIKPRNSKIEMINIEFSDIYS